MTLLDLCIQPPFKTAIYVHAMTGGGGAAITKCCQ